ncbi:unnamed protein product [Auanema sp. JU1783]|nr:unnamed protein product [Auanema sp. JU1783]
MKFSISSARTCMTSGDTRNAVFNYLMVLKPLEDSKKMKFVNEFLECFKAYVENLNNKEDVCEFAVEIFPQCCQVYFFCAFFKYSRDDLLGALNIISFVLNSIDHTPLEKIAIKVFECNLRSHIFPVWHMIMLNDHVRNSKYAQAIEKIITPEDVVLDIGSGSGFLSVLAAKKCSKVIAIESNPNLFSISQSVILDNTERITGEIIAKNMHSTDFQPKPEEKASVVIAEIMDCCAFGEGIIPTFYDAHQRLVQPNCRFSPSLVELYITVYESIEILNTHYFMENRSQYTYPKQDTTSEPYWCCKIEQYPDAKPLSAPVKLITVHLDDIEDLSKYMIGVKNTITVEVKTEGTACIVVAHFRAVLADDVEISTQKETFWEHGIFILSEQERVHEGQQMNLSYSLKKNRLSIWNSATETEKLNETSRYVVIEQEKIETLRSVGFSEEAIRNLPTNINKVGYAPSSIPFPRPFLELPEFITLSHKDLPNIGVLCKGQNGITSNMGPCDRFILWPARIDGSLNSDLLEEVRTVLDRQLMVIHRTFPEHIECRGYLFQSEYLTRRCRPDETAHMNVNLRELTNWTLLEYRDIKLDGTPHIPMSEEIDVFKIRVDTITTHLECYMNVVTVNSTPGEKVDGIVYWFHAGDYSNKNEKVAAFMFDKPYVVPSNGLVTILVYIHKSQMVITTELTQDNSD